MAAEPVKRESGIRPKQHILFVRTKILMQLAHSKVFAVSQKINRLSPAVIVGTLRLRVNGRRL